MVADLDRRWAEERRSLAHEPERVRQDKHTKFRSHKAILTKWLLPTLRQLTYSEITIPVIAGLVDSIRLNDGVDPDNPTLTLTRGPAQSTIGSIAHTYSIVMSQMQKMVVVNAPFPRITQKGHRVAAPRPSLQAKEMSAIIAAMDDIWIDTPKKARDRQIRQLLRAQVILLGLTGMRPGSETNRLRYGQFEEVQVRETERISKNKTISKLVRFTRIEIFARQGKYSESREAVVNALEGVMHFLGPGLARVDVLSPASQAVSV